MNQLARVCIKCGVEKPIDQFSINRHKTGGRHSYCRDCLLAYNRAYGAANAEAISAKRKAYRAANLEKLRERNKAYYDANREDLLARQRVVRAADDLEVKAARRARSRWNNAKRKYGLTLDDYNRMLERQGGLCANPGCFNEPPIDGRFGRFDVDHDHSCCPGKESCGKCIRGLLCGLCNRALGMLQDDVKRIRGLADYLEPW